MEATQTNSTTHAAQNTATDDQNVIQTVPQDVPQPSAEPSSDPVRPQQDGVNTISAPSLLGDVKQGASKTFSKLSARLRHTHAKSAKKTAEEQHNRTARVAAEASGLASAVTKTAVASTLSTVTGLAHGVRDGISPTRTKARRIDPKELEPIGCWTGQKELTLEGGNTICALTVRLIADYNGQKLPDPQQDTIQLNRRVLDYTLWIDGENVSVKLIPMVSQKTEELRGFIVAEQAAGRRLWIWQG